MTELSTIDEKGSARATGTGGTSSMTTSSSTGTSATADGGGGGRKIDASIIAQPFREEIRERVSHLKRGGMESPLLVGLLANDDPAALKYAEWTGRACRADGLRYDLRMINDEIDVEAALRDANDDPRVHGIIVYYPIFGHHEKSFSGASHDDFLRDTVSVRKDVEGLCHTYRANLYRNVRFLDYPRDTQKCLLPCTALSVVKILETLPNCHDPSLPVGRRMEGRIVTVINRSEIVGRPLAAMLANDGATVYSVDVDSIYLLDSGGNRMHHCTTDTVEGCVRRSSIIITGVPTKSYRLPTGWIQPNSTVVNVASYKNVDEAELLKIRGVTYVPMVGKVTVAMLERNLVRLFDNFHHPDHLGSSRVAGGPPRGDGERGVAGRPSWLQVYTAAMVTALVALTVARSK